MPFGGHTKSHCGCVLLVLVVMHFAATVFVACCAAVQC